MVDLREEEMTWFTCFHNFATKKTFFDGLNKKGKVGKREKGDERRGKGKSQD